MKTNLIYDFTVLKSFVSCNRLKYIVFSDLLAYLTFYR